MRNDSELFFPEHLISRSRRSWKSRS